MYHCVCNIAGKNLGLIMQTGHATPTKFIWKRLKVIEQKRAGLWYAAGCFNCGFVMIAQSLAIYRQAFLKFVRMFWCLITLHCM